MKDIIITLVTILLIIFLLSVVNNEKDARNELRKVYKEVELETNNLQVEKKKLEKKLSSLKQEMSKTKKGKLSLSLLFLETDELFFSEIVPKLNENNLVATLCLNENNIPEKDDLIAQKQIKNLISSGWETAMFWKGDSDFLLWYETTSALINDAGLETPDILYIEKELYNETLTTALKNAGIQHLIIRVSNSSEYFPNNDESLNVINSFGWFTSSSIDLLSSLTIPDPQIAFIIGTESKDVRYEKTQFSALIEQILLRIGANSLIATTPDGSLRQKTNDREEYLELLEEHNQKVELLQERIDELDEKISNRYDNYLSQE